jgi:hypothetical protein
MNSFCGESIGGQRFDVILKNIILQAMIGKNDPNQLVL